MRSDSRRVRIIAMMFAGAICLTYVLVNPASQDFASGHFRAQLAGRGVYLWNNLWFGGHPLPGFGVVSPVVGGLIGVVPLSVISVVVATWCFTLVIERWRNTAPGLPRQLVGVVLFAFGCGANLWGGRLYVPAGRDVRYVGAAAVAASTPVADGGVRRTVRVVFPVGSSVVAGDHRRNLVR